MTDDYRCSADRFEVPSVQEVLRNNVPHLRCYTGTTSREFWLQRLPVCLSNSCLTAALDLLSSASSAVCTHLFSPWTVDNSKAYNRLKKNSGMMSVLLKLNQRGLC